LNGSYSFSEDIDRTLYWVRVRKSSSLQTGSANRKPHHSYFCDRRFTPASANALPPEESTDLRLSQACRPYATPSSISFFDRHLSDARTAEDEAVKSRS